MEDQSCQEDETSIPQTTVPSEDLALPEVDAGEVAAAEEASYEALWRRIEAELGQKKHDSSDKLNGSINEECVLSEPDVGPTAAESLPGNINPEEDELLPFQMPPLKTVAAELSRLRTNKRVIVYPLTRGEIEHPVLARLLNSDDCLEYRLKFVRDQSDGKIWNGFLSLYFSSRAGALQALEDIKSIRSDLTVEFTTQETPAYKGLARPSYEDNATHTWHGRMLFVRNIGPNVTPEMVKELFPDAEDVVLPRDRQTGRGKAPLKLKGYAYVVYHDETTATDAVAKYTTAQPMLDHRLLNVMKYTAPVTMPQGLLTLGERKLILKHGNKSSSMVEKSKKGIDVKSLDSWNKKLQACIRLIETDNSARRALSLPTPSYSELCAIKHLPPIDSKKSQQTLERLGVLDTKTARPATVPTRPQGGASNAFKAPKNPKFANKRTSNMHRGFGMTPGLLGHSPSAHMGGLLGPGPMPSGMMGHVQQFNASGGGYGRGTGKNQYRRAGFQTGGGDGGAGFHAAGGDQRELANSVGMLVNLSHMLAQQLEFQNIQQRRPGLLPGPHQQPMYTEHDYSRGNKYPQNGSAPQHGSYRGGLYQPYGSARY